MPHAIMSSFRNTKIAMDSITKIMNMLIKSCSIDSGFRGILEDSSFDITQHDDETILNFDFAPSVSKGHETILKMAYDLNKLMGTFNTEEKLVLTDRMTWKSNRFIVHLSFNHAGPQVEEPIETIEDGADGTKTAGKRLVKKEKKN